MEDSFVLTGGDFSDISEPIINNEHNSKHNENNGSFLLAGGDFPNDVVNIFKELANDLEFTNVTLVTDGGTCIKAHKVVLSAFSPFFKSLLVNNPHQHPLLYLRGVQYEDLRAILDFIYLGQTKVDMHKINQFIKLATDLQIKGLRTTIESSKDETNVSEETGKEVISRNTGSENCITSYESNSGIKEEPSLQFNCHLCEYQGGEKRDMMSHIEKTHREDIYTCNQCEFYTGTKDSLLEHIRTNHT